MRKRRSPIVYSVHEMKWLKANRKMVISGYRQAFVAKFKRRDVTVAHLHGLRKRKGWKVGRAKGRTAGRHRKYSETEIIWLKENSAKPIAEFHRAFCSKFEREDVTAEKLNSLRKRMGWKTGRTGRFEKGHSPDNKGKKMPYHPNSARTQFKAGQLPHNTKYAGHERVSKEGYVEISVEERNPHTGYERRYVLKHQWIWEQTNGPVPEGMALKCLDGNKQNTDPSNWEAVSRGVLARLNGGRHRKRIAYDGAPDELKPTVMAIAKIEQKAHEIRRSKPT